MYFGGEGLFLATLSERGTVLLHSYHLGGVGHSVFWVGLTEAMISFEKS